MLRSKIRQVILVLFAGLPVLCPIDSWPQARKTTAASPITVAKSEISRGQLDDAEKNLWNVLASDPNQPEGLTLLGIVRELQKRYPEAEALLRRVLQLDSKSVAAHRDLARILVVENKPDAALAEYERLVELAPEDNEPKVGLARLYVARGRFDDALSVLDRIPQSRFPSEGIPPKAASLLALDRREDAAALILSVEKSLPAEMELAEVFLDGNAPDLAKKVIDNAKAKANARARAQSGLRQPPAHLYYLQGRVLQATGDPSAAVKSFEEALTRDPKSVEALLSLAAIKASDSNHADSLALLKRASTLQPESPVVLRPLIVEAIKMGEPKTATRAARALADTNPQDLDDLYLAAAAMLEGKDFVTATAVLDKYTKERPDDSKGLLGLGIAELAQQHYPEARKALERAIQNDPALADAEYELGTVADHQGAAAEAIRHFERTIQLQPKHAEALTNLGRLYLQTGDLEKARELLERSIAVDPDNPKAQYDLALALSKLGRTEEAKQHMERSRALQMAEELGKNPDPAK